MRLSCFSSSILLASLAISVAGVRSLGQAKVSETQSNSIYVDAKKGSDDETTSAFIQGMLMRRGAVSLPYKTIQAALNKANAIVQRGVSTKVVVNPGVYRESIALQPAKTAATLTIQASSTGASEISGSDVVRGWNWDSSNPTVYSSSWSSSHGSCSIPSGWPTNFAPIAQRTEMLFVNDVPLNQVMSHSEMRTGTFFVDDSGGRIYMAPPSGTDVGSSTVEVAARAQIFTIEGRSNVVVRGLVFSHAASCMNDSGAIISDSDNVLVDSVQANWNNWGGLGIYGSTNVTVQNSVASHNGGVGFQGVQDTNALYTFNESDFNNWRGAMGALYDWGMGGTKLMLMRSTTVKDHYSYHNQAQGLWFDTDNENITVDNATLADNVMAGLQIERNEGPITLTNSTVCSNGVGVNVLTSEKVSIRDSVLYNNGGTNADQAQIFLGGTRGGQTIQNWQTGDTIRLFTTGMDIEGNTIEDASGGQFVFGTFLDSSDWSKFAHSISASDNRWYDPHTTHAFQLTGGDDTTLSGWQHATDTDGSSHWEHASSGDCSVAGDADFVVNLDSRSYSMSRGKAVVTARVASFEGKPVTLSVAGLPHDVSASLSQQTVTNGEVKITLSASSGASHQMVPITLFADGYNMVHSVTFYVYVS